MSLLCALILALSFFNACGEKQLEWQGTIEEINGVKIITNPNEPIYGELIFELEEDLSIGNDEDDNYLFYRISRIGVDQSGNIYVMDRGNFRVQKYDSTGRYLCTMGREGQGPGEFRMPFNMIVDDVNGTLVVQDMRKLIRFDLEGNYLDQDLALDNFFYDLFVTANGHFWGNMHREEGDDEATADLFRVLVEMGLNGQIVKEIVSFPEDHYRQRLESGAVLSVSTGEEHSLVISFLDGENIIYGYSGEYVLNVIDLEGRVHTKIKKDEPLQDFTAAERRKSKRAPLPEYRPFFYYIFSDSASRIYVQRTSARVLQQVEKEFDVFSRSGFFLYRTVCPLTPFIIQDGYFYTRIADEETGDVFVKRYKILNWDQIKTDR